MTLLYLLSDLWPQVWKTSKGLLTSVRGEQESDLLLLAITLGLKTLDQNHQPHPAVSSLAILVQMFTPGFKKHNPL